MGTRVASGHLNACHRRGWETRWSRKCPIVAPGWIVAHSYGTLTDESTKDITPKLERAHAQADDPR